MKRLLFLLWISSCFGMEEEHTYSLTIHETHTSNHNSLDKDILTARTLQYFLGRSSIELNGAFAPLMRQHIKESKVDDEELWQAVSQLNPDDKLSDSQEMDIKMREIKRLMADSIESIIKKKNEDTADAQLQLQLKDKDLRNEKYKFYGVLAGLGGTLLTSVVTISSLLISQQVSE